MLHAAQPLRHQRRGLAWGAIVQSSFYLYFDIATVLRLPLLTSAKLETRNSTLEFGQGGRADR